MSDLAVDAASFDQAGLQLMAGLAESDEHSCSGITSSDDSRPPGNATTHSFSKSFKDGDDADRAPAVAADARGASQESAFNWVAVSAL
jgi:hypothetical protein